MLVSLPSDLVGELQAEKINPWPQHHRILIQSARLSIFYKSLTHKDEVKLKQLPVSSELSLLLDSRKSSNRAVPPSNGTSSSMVGLFLSVIALWLSTGVDCDVYQFLIYLILT